MIEYVYRRAVAASRPTSVLVATDDARIHAAVRAFGGDAQLTSPEHRNGTERLAEVARDLTADVIVNLQADEPLMEPGMIDLVVDTLESETDAPMTTLRTPLAAERDARDPDVVKVVVDRQGFALYFSRAPIPYVAQHGNNTAAESTYKHIGLYAYRRAFLLQMASLPPTPLEQAERLEQLRVLEHGYRIKTEVTAHDPIGVDTSDDLERVRQIIGAGASR